MFWRSASLFASTLDDIFAATGGSSAFTAVLIIVAFILAVLRSRFGVVGVRLLDLCEKVWFFVKQHIYPFS